MNATQIIVETETQQIRVALREPMTLSELWAHFVSFGSQPSAITMTKGLARVVLADRKQAA